MEEDGLQQGRRNGVEATRKRKISTEINTEREITVRMVDLTDRARDACWHCFCSFPWRVPCCSTFKAVVVKGCCSVLLAPHRSVSAVLDRRAGWPFSSPTSYESCLNRASGFCRVTNSRAAGACSPQLLGAVLRGFRSVWRSRVLGLVVKYEMSPCSRKCSKN